MTDAFINIHLVAIRLYRMVRVMEFKLIYIKFSENLDEQVKEKVLIHIGHLGAFFCY